MKNYFERTSLRTGEVKIVSVTDPKGVGAEMQCKRLNKIFEGVAIHKVATEEQKLAKMKDERQRKENN